MGVWLGLPALWLLLGTVITLMAWDLACFSQRLAGIKQKPPQATLQQAHLRRLLIVDGGGFLLGVIALEFQVSLNFGWAVFLGFLTAISLSWVVGFIRRARE